MAPIKNSWIAFCILTVASLSFGQQPEPLMNVEEILEQLSSDFHTTETLIALNQSLKQPGITPALVAAFKRDYFGPPPTANSRFTALSGLSERSDIPESDLALITNELEKRSVIVGTLSRDDESLATVALPILKHYPSAYHEELALRFVKMDKATAIDSAVSTLEAIGSDRSLPTLRAFREELVIKYPGCETIKLTDAAITAIEKRGLKYPDTPTLETTQSSVDETKSSTKNAPENFKGDARGWWVIALILLSLGAGVWFRRRTLGR